MADALAACGSLSVSRAVIAGGAAPSSIADRTRVHDGAHPAPDARSVRAGEDALALARRPDAGALVVLLSGGASSMLAVPAEGLSIELKRAVTERLLAAGVEIGALNCVRKHLSGIKGGRLAAASTVPVIALAISDVIGDDPAVIASGPTVADPTTYKDALAVLERAGGRSAYPPAVVSHLARGARGEIDETPKPGDPRLRTARTEVIGSARDALEGARRAAERLGYHVLLLPRRIEGEARRAGDALAHEHVALAARHPSAFCVLSAGETTVRVTGSGRGGRNQELALGWAMSIGPSNRAAALASVGTDGVDGPTDAAGALADSSTAGRAAVRGLAPMQYLDNNDACPFFEALGDLVRTGPTGTNVGDLQVALIASGDGEPGREP
jgi:glycerate 2-kinase